MKILSIVPYKIFPAKVGGQKGIALFNEYLAKNSLLECITVRSNDPVYAKGYKVFNIIPNGPSRYFNPFLFFTIRRNITQQGYTHLILEHPYLGWLGILLKQFIGIKLVIHSHNIESTRWQSLGKWWWKILRWYESSVHRNADYNFFIHDEDRAFAIKAFKLIEKRCTTITYGIEIDKAPSPLEKQDCKRLLRQQHQIAMNQTVFLFNGALDYKPNFDAVINIVDKINPYLLATNFQYKIIICGRGLPPKMELMKAYADRNIIYAGFVDDITIYFKGADIFINPVTDGGGIKTKMVEALGYNTRVISTSNGSIGVTEIEAGGQLTIVKDNDWEHFSETMIRTAAEAAEDIPDSFFTKFYWGNIAQKAIEFIGGDKPRIH